MEHASCNQPASQQDDDSSRPPHDALDCSHNNLELAGLQPCHCNACKLAQPDEMASPDTVKLDDARSVSDVTRSSESSTSLAGASVAIMPSQVASEDDADSITAAAVRRGHNNRSPIVSTLTGSGSCGVVGKLPTQPRHCSATPLLPPLYNHVLLATNFDRSLTASQLHALIEQICNVVITMVCFLDAAGNVSFSSSRCSSQINGDCDDDIFITKHLARMSLSTKQTDVVAHDIDSDNAALSSVSPARSMSNFQNLKTSDSKCDTDHTVKKTNTTQHFSIATVLHTAASNHAIASSCSSSASNTATASALIVCETAAAARACLGKLKHGSANSTLRLSACLDLVSARTLSALPLAVRPPRFVGLRLFIDFSFFFIRMSKVDILILTISMSTLKIECLIVLHVTYVNIKLF